LRAIAEAILFGASKIFSSCNSADWNHLSSLFASVFVAASGGCRAWALLALFFAVVLLLLSVFVVVVVVVALSSLLRCCCCAV
jgi:hypothetical protein